MSRRTEAASDSPLVRCSLLTLSLGFLALFIALPLAAVFVQAFDKGWHVYWDAVRSPDALAALRLEPAGNRDRRSAEPGLRRRRRLGDCQVRVPRKEPCS